MPFLGLLLFFIYINDLSEGLTTNVRLFADDVSLFSVVDKINFSTTNLNIDLRHVNARASQWKMTFNPNPNEQVQEVIFSRKIKNTLHPPLNFDNNSLLSKYSLKNIWAFI